MKMAFKFIESTGKYSSTMKAAEVNLDCDEVSAIKTLEVLWLAEKMMCLLLSQTVHNRSCSQQKEI